MHDPSEPAPSPTSVGCSKSRSMNRALLLASSSQSQYTNTKHQTGRGVVVLHVVEYKTNHRLYHATPLTPYSTH